MKRIVWGLFGIFIGFATGTVIAWKHSSKDILRWKADAEKIYNLFLLSNRFIKLKQENANIPEYLHQKGYKRIGIYGLSYLGERLLEELAGSSIEVLYVVDQNASSIYYPEITLYTMEDELEEVDAIIVTAVSSYDEIKIKLEKKMGNAMAVISVEDVLYLL